MLTPEEQENLRASVAESMETMAAHFGLVPRWKGKMRVWSARKAHGVRVTGRVQGVFFRQSAVAKASELGVGGWVRNCPDGSVEAHVEGGADAIEAMVSWLRHGPLHAQVDHVQVTDAEPQDMARFDIRS